ncbi:FtsK/SpoIIIE domain-containing protein [Actinomycetospora chlora]|uniref:FtsK/SpoIIIE domain-containing protein n=1 Tax=Actinomycetospora chlora TaxID=663608 RepID=A0ABP9BI13_9PSEU
MFTHQPFRGSTIRRRADVQRTAIVREPDTLSSRLGLAAGRGLFRLALLAVWAAVMAIWLLAYVPILGAVVALAVLLGAMQGVAGFLAVLAVALAAGVTWWWSHGASFDRLISSRVFRFGRRIRYRSGFADLMASAGLQARDASARLVVPRLLWCRLGPHADLLTVQLCPGVTREDLEERTDELRSEFRALDVRVLAHRRRGWVWLRVICADTLMEATAPPSSAHAVDLEALPLGRREDGSPWRLRLLGRHVLMAGASGSGKSSMVAGLLVALAPAIREGLVRVIGIDPKGGMEFGMYAELFHLLAADSDEHLVVGLEAAAALTAQRTRELRSRTRQHVPTTAEPFYVVLVDEVASLTTYIADRGLRSRAQAALGQLLTKGRAPGVSVVGCVQDPRKEVVGLRGLFTTRVGLRMTEKTEVAMVLGDGARDRGARCDQISALTPGIGYVVDDEDQTLTKVRSVYVDDEQMRWLARTYPSPTREDIGSVIPVQREEAGQRKKAKTGTAKTSESKEDSS